MTNDDTMQLVYYGVLLLVMGLAWGVEGRRPARLALGASVLGVAGMGVLMLSPRTVWEPQIRGASAVSRISPQAGRAEEEAMQLSRH